MILKRSVLRFPVVLLLLSAFDATAQKKAAVPQQCATMPRLQTLLENNPKRTQLFAAGQAVLNRLALQRTAQRTLRAEAITNIPVVFHVVLPNPALVTDAQLLAQLDTLNKSFSGTAGDTVQIPVYFKPLQGRSDIRFCLAQRTPAGEESTGILRTTTTRSSFEPDDAMKHVSTGGANSWNTDDYLNVWICNLSGGVLGYATFPNDGQPAEQGVVIDYRTLPGGSSTNYNSGKTLVHETGHFFNLSHIWGDDNGLCTGTDNVNDTPNQGDASGGCSTGVRTDNCTPAGNGIMYQNYMDYSYDRCLVMFTIGQVARMETALSLYRASLLTSNGCRPVERKDFDVQIRAILNPAQRLCSQAFAPVVTIRNNGTQTVTSVVLSAENSNGVVVTTTWTGSLPSTASTTVTLPGLTATTGVQVLTVYASNPNGVADEEKSSDTLRRTFQYYPPVPTVNESFESVTFPPPAWDLVNPDRGPTWQRVTGVAKTGTGSVFINNIDYDAIGERDDLRLPQVSLPATADSAFLSFGIAAAAYNDVTTANNVWDTLEVLVSTDCGLTYTSVYKKWGATLVTLKTPLQSAFVPAPADWRKDSINLGAFLGQGNLLVAFRNTTGYENNIYLDDIRVRTVTVNPNLKRAGFLVTPNPTSGHLTVQFFPQPVNLRSLQVFNATGQKLREISVGSGSGNNLYQLDLSRFAAGIYFVRAVFTDRTAVQKIIKQ